jgi:hypothetical protein
MPECMAGESAQDYFSRILAQCALESATSAENTSGDSAPTPFNIGQIQADVARNTADIDVLETDVAGIQSTVDTLNGQLVTGIVQYSTGATSSVQALPEVATWRVFVTPNGQPLVDLYVNVTASSFTALYDATAAAGSFTYLAVKIPS